MRPNIDNRGKLFRACSYAAAFVLAAVVPLIGRTAELSPKPPTCVSIDGAPCVTGKHSFTQLPQTANGWTDLLAMWQTPGAYLDSRVIYVSESEGNDSTARTYSREDAAVGSNPFEPAGPVSAYKSVSVAQSKLRHGYPDLLLLKRGDVFTTAFSKWVTGGRSVAERQIVAAYGTSGDRPQFRLDGRTLLRTDGGSSSPSSISFLVFSDIAATQVSKDPRESAFTPGLGNTPLMSWLWTSEHVLFEGMYFGFGEVSIQKSGTKLDNIAFRRTVFADDYSTDSHAQGIFASGASGLLIEESVFDHNGWHESVSGAGPTIFNHNVYIQNGSTGVSFVRNISARASSHGIQLRPGGVIEGNLFLANPLNALLGGGTSPEPGGVDGRISDNVILGSRDINSSNPRGGGIDTSNLNTITISGNVVAHISNASTGSRAPLNVSLSSSTDSVVLTGNTVWEWRGSVSVSGTPASGASISISGNKVLESSSVDIFRVSTTNVTSSRNLFSSVKSNPFAVAGTQTNLAGFKDAVGDTTSAAWSPSGSVPTIEDYMGHIGRGSTLEEFLAGARQQTRWSWRPEFTAAQVNAYVKGIVDKL